MVRMVDVVFGLVFAQGRVRPQRARAGALGAEIDGGDRLNLVWWRGSLGSQMAVGCVTTPPTCYDF